MTVNTAPATPALALPLACTDSPREESPKDTVKETESEPAAVVVPKPGEIEELVRVDRRKLEELILGQPCVPE